MSIQDRDIAEGFTSVASYAPVPLYAGDQDVLTDSEFVAPNQSLAKYTVVARNASRQLVPVAPAASDGTQIPVGVISQPIVTGVAASKIGYFKGGFFNFAALTWPNTVTTVAQAQALFEKAPSGVVINIGLVRL